MGKFTLTKKTDLTTLENGAILEESDFSINVNNQFLQFKYKEESKDNSYEVSPGIFNIAIKNNQMILAPTKFTEEKIVEDYSVTETICKQINTFFNKVDVYLKRGLFPKWGILLYGYPGCGKSQTISKIAKTYLEKKDTVIIVWRTDKFEARHIKDFLASFKFINGAKNMVLIAEDIGGMEYVGSKMRIDSSLLSLLDNKEQTFTVPTVVIATTNAPENLLHNLTDRPDRFDDKIEVPRPSADFRKKFLEFFSHGTATPEDLDKITDKKYGEFSVAHIKNIVFRSELKDLTISQAIDEVYEQMKLAKEEFVKRAKLGMGL